MSGITPFYESARAVAEYLLFHYGSAEEILPYPFGPVEALFFPVRCVRETFQLEGLPSPVRGLDLGCAVGRSSFEMARFCDEVVGIDASRAFIAAACQVRDDPEFGYDYPVEGEITARTKAWLPPEIVRSRVSFECGDATDLRPELGKFDMVLMANLIDRLPDPERCLVQLRGLINPGGQLCITSPYTWTEDYTPRHRWLGGSGSDQTKGHTFQALRQLLSPAFELVKRIDLPFLIREHARKFQWSVAEATVWRRP